MSYAFFTARGIVKETQILSTKTGKEFRTILLDIGDGRYDRVLEVNAWNQVAQSAEKIKQGDEVEITGRLESKENNGYYNARVTAQNVFNVKDIEGESDEEKPSTQNAFEQINNNQKPIADDDQLFDADIPF
jgi:DNA replicative helicase MCM subunit Mcm2 (Cdc46/Mcm family)